EPRPPPNEDQGIGVRIDVREGKAFSSIAGVVRQAAAPASDSGDRMVQGSRRLSALGEQPDGRAFELDKPPARPASVLITDQKVGSEPRHESRSGNHPARVTTGEMSNEDRRARLEKSLERRLADPRLQVGPEPRPQSGRRRSRPDPAPPGRVAVNPRSPRAFHQRTPDGPHVLQRTRSLGDSRIYARATYPYRLLLRIPPIRTYSALMDATWSFLISPSTAFTCRP